MRRIDELHMEFPFAGARMLARLLRREGHEIGRRRVRTLMKRMGIEALYCKPNTSRRNAQHKIWPYLLRGMTINRANQVWALDTSYIPMARGFVYLTAVVDWASRKVLAHRVAITMEAMHAVEALEEAFAKYGRPEIVNTDSKNVGTNYSRPVCVLQASTIRGRSGAVERSGQPDPNTDRLIVFPWTCRSSGTAERRGFASSIHVTQEGPDALSLYCLVQVLDVGGIAQSKIENWSKAA
jgi:hypothetical protein